MRKKTVAALAGIAEMSCLLLMLAWQASRILPTAAHRPANLALLISDALPVALVLFRRPADSISQSGADWLVAYAGAIAPLLMAPGGQPLVNPALCSVLMIAGVLINLYGKASLARSFGLVAANRGVQRLGPYRVVRHPIYAGNALTQIGFVLMYPTVFNIALCAAALSLQVIRLKAEERLLGEDPVYAQYMAKVPYRLAPGVF
jgi:protein-S-isoprenylcysteine O-methyltransferase Ste14